MMTTKTNVNKQLLLHTGQLIYSLRPFYYFQALNMLNMSMARGMGLPHLPHPHGGHPLAGHPGVNGAPHLPTHHALTSSAGAVIGRPTSTPSTGSTNNAFNGKSWTHWRISGNRRPPKTRK